MGQKDIKVNEYLNDNVRFADLHNVLTFQGKRILDPEKLEDVDTRLNYRWKSLRVFGKARYSQMQRDAIKKQAMGIRFLLVASEHQSKIDLAMTIRNNLYDAAEYDRQYKQIRKKNRRNGIGPKDFLSGFTKEDRISPVVTLVLYTGTEPWTGHLELHDVMHLEEYPKEIQEILRKRVNNYKIEVVDIHHIDNYEDFQSDLRLVAGFMNRNHDKDQLLEYVNENEESFSMIEEDTYDLLSELSGHTELIEIKEEIREEGGLNMCKALDDLLNDRKAEGIEVGKAEGKAEAIVKLCREFQLPEEEIVERLMKELQVSEEQARAYL